MGKRNPLPPPRNGKTRELGELSIACHSWEHSYFRRIGTLRSARAS